jgi:hypothetical protein
MAGEFLGWSPAWASESSFCGVASGETSLLACTFYYLWSIQSWGSCLYKGDGLPGVSVKIAGHLVGKHGALGSYVCEDLLSRECQMMEPGAISWLQGQRVRSVELRVLLLIPPVVSLFVDLERVLLLAGYGTLWVIFGVLWSSFFRIVTSGCQQSAILFPPLIWVLNQVAQ